MVAPRQVRIPYYRCCGQQRGRGVSALVQIIWRRKFSSLRKHVVPAAKRVSVDLMEFAVPEISEVVSGRKKFETSAKILGSHLLRKQLGSSCKNRTLSRVIRTKTALQTSRLRRDISTNISH